LSFLGNRKTASLPGLKKSTPGFISVYSDRSYRRDPLVSLGWYQVVPQGFGGSLRSRVESMSKDFEFKKQYGLTRDFEQIEQNRRSSEFLKNEVFNDLRQFHLNKAVGTVRGVTQRLATDDSDFVLRQVRNPLAVAIGAAGVMTGQPLVVWQGAGARLSSQTYFTIDEPRFTLGRGQFNLNSWVLDSSLSYDSSAAEIREPAKAAAGEQAHKKERYRLTFNRELPWVGVASGFSFGSTSSLLTASLSRRLTDRLSCTVDSSRALSVDRVESQFQEERISFVYGFGF
jgi:hypothetical protein